MSRVLLSLPYFYRQDASLNLTLTNLTRPTGQKEPGILLSASLALELQVGNRLGAFLWGLGVCIF